MIAASVTVIAAPLAYYAPMLYQSIRYKGVSMMCSNGAVAAVPFVLLLL